MAAVPFLVAGLPILLMLFLVAMERLEAHVVPRPARGRPARARPVRASEPFARNG